MARNDNDYRPVSDERLHQHSGSENAFGGYEKVNHGNGSFSMRPTHDD